MDTRPLYLDDELLAAVETAPRFDVDAASGSCRRCRLCGPARTVCMQPDVVGDDGPVLLVVGEQPSAADDRSGLPFDDDAGDFVRAEISKSWPGRVVYDYGIRCRSHYVQANKLAKSITACRGYLRDVIERHKPDRIIALGPLAFSALLDRTPPAGSVRKSYAFLSDGTPVFLCMPQGPALRNRFLTAWLREDLAWACKAERPVPTMWDAEFFVVRTPEDSRRAVKSLRAARWFVFDCETSGVFGDSYFRVLCLGACPGMSESPFVWPESALADPDVLAPLLELLEDPDVGKAGHNIKYDVVTVANAWGAKVRGVWCDTMLDRNCVQADALARLDIAAELVGMGGLKHQLEHAVTLGVQAINAARKQALTLSKTGGKAQQSLLGMEDPCIAAAVRQIDVKPKRFAYALVPEAMLLRYVARDVVAPARLVELQRYGEVGASKSTTPEQVGRRSLSLRWSRLRKPADVTLTKAVHAYAQIERWGIAANRDAMRQFNIYLRQSVDQAAKRLDAEGLVNPNAPEQVSAFLFDKLGLAPNDRFMTTKGPSSSKGHIADLIHRYPDCAGLLNAILDYRRLSKLLGTYAEGLIVHIRQDGRIHPHFKLMGATTGRPSCLAGWTLVKTHRGDVPIEDVRAGDRVWTHRGRWRRVKSQWLVGVRETFDVELTNGQVLTCTGSHRLLSSDGQWRFVDECVEALGFQSRESSSSPVIVQGSSAVAESQTGRQGVGNDGAERRCCVEAVHVCGGAEGAFCAAVLGCEDRREKPDAWEDGRSAPQLEGGVRGRLRVSDVPVEREAGVCASCSVHGGPWSFVASEAPRCSPHQRGQEGQSVGQLGTCDAGWPYDDPFTSSCGHRVVGVAKIYYRGSLPVFDISVEEDESYATCGIFSHNCEDPNLQVLPRTSTVEGRMTRDCFCVPPGRMLIELDYSQIEIRVAAGLSNDQVMLDIFREGARSVAAGGPDADLHWRTVKIIARDAWGIDPSTLHPDGAQTPDDKAHRSISKAITFGKMYGKRNSTLARELGITLEAADKIDAAILGGYAGFAAWCDEQRRLGSRYGEAWTWWAGDRFRRRPLWQIGDSQMNGRPTSRAITAENSFVNSPIQGTGSEFCVQAAIDVVDACERGHLGDDTSVNLTIHDALILECDEDLVDMIIPKTKAIMLQHATPGGVPFAVDAKVGRSLGSLKEYHG